MWTQQRAGISGLAIIVSTFRSKNNLFLLRFLTSLRGCIATVELRNKIFNVSTFEFLQFSKKKYYFFHFLYDVKLSLKKTN